MKTKMVALVMSINVTSNVQKNLFAGFTGGYAAAGQNALGVFAEDMPAGQMAPVDVFGITLVTAGGAIGIGQEVEVGTGGKAVAKNTGYPVGVALDPATADGDLIRVKLK